MTNHTLSVRQVQVLFFVDLLGISMLYLPSLAAALGGSFCALWVGCGVLVWAFFGAMAAQSSGAVLEKSRWGRSILLFFSIKNLLQGAVWLRLLSGSLSVLLLPKTPLFFLEGAMVALLYYGFTKGPACRGRVAEVLLLPILLVLLAVCLFSIAGVEQSNITLSRPSGGGTTIGLVALSGFGVDHLLFVSALDGGRRPSKGVFCAGASLALVLAALTALAFAVFGQTGMAIHRYPLLQLMDTIDFPLLFVERQDVWMVGVWICSAFLFLWGCLFFCAWLLGRAVRRGSERKYGLGAALLLLALCRLLQTEAAAMEMLRLLLWANGAGAVVIFALFLKERRGA